MIIRWIVPLLIGATLVAAPPPPLATRIRAVISRSKIAATSFLGVEIIDASSGSLVYRLNSEHFFVPASNTKLFTTALALKRLGAGYRIHTNITASQAPDANGVVSGDLILNGAGDPSLKTADIESLASQLYERGVRRIEGSVIGDDTAFLWEPYSPGWSIDDAVESYGAPVSALALNDNSITLHLSPAAFSFDPAVPLFAVENQLQQSDTEPIKIHLDRLPGSSTLRIWGTAHAASGQSDYLLGVDDPARYAALVLFDALARRGIQIVGNAHARHRLPGDKFPAALATTILAQHDSAPLVEDLRLTDKTSQNLHAETYLHLVARERTGQGSRAAGLAELYSFLEEAGLDKDHYAFYDGSGLSRLNVVTPHAVTSLLHFMAKSSVSEDWFTLLPIAGVDGTLENRMKGRKTKGLITAKTGSLSHVSALSGYAQHKGGKRYAFSIIMNNYNVPSSEVRELIDKICSLLVE